jgi:glycosyltransferase involved in cell wall biosynthesis
MRAGEAEEAMVDLSLIIATRNRARSLEATLDRLRRQAPEGACWEVIVVDNGSADDTPQVIERAGKDLPLVALYEPVPGKNRALNRALEAARGGLLVFTDDNVDPGPGWLSEIHRASRERNGYNIFCGPIIPNYQEGTPDWLTGHRFSVVAFGSWSPDKPEGELRATPCGANYAIRASALGRLRFRTDLGPQQKGSPLGGETELLHRLFRRGERVIYVPTAVVGHDVDERQTRLGWLLNRAFRHGRGRGFLARETQRPHFLGAPTHLWGRIPIAMAEFLLSVLLIPFDRRAPLDRFEWGIRLTSDCGEFYQCLLMALKRKLRLSADDEIAAAALPANLPDQI